MCLRVESTQQLVSKRNVSGWFSNSPPYAHRKLNHHNCLTPNWTKSTHPNIIVAAWNKFLWNAPYCFRCFSR